MQARLQRNVGFSLIMFAFFFLFEPTYALVDALPDFIGYTILCVALINLADINDKIATSFKGFRNAIAISVLRYISMIYLNNAFSENEQSVGRLLFVFVFAILDLVIIIPAYRALFEGLLTLGLFEGGEAVYLKKKENGRNATEKIFSLTVLFLVFKNIICALPEFTSLQSNSGYEFVGVIRILAILLVAPISIIWLINILLYFRRIKNDTPFIEALSAKYMRKAEATPDYFTRRALTFALYTVLAAFVFTFDFYVENVNILPDIIFYGIVILMAVILRKKAIHRVKVVVLSALGSMISAGIGILEKDFFSRFTIEAVIKNFEAYNKYNLLVVLYAMKGIIFALLTYFVLKSVYNAFDAYIVTKQTDNESYVQEHGKALRTRIIIAFSLSLLSALSTMYRVLTLPHYDTSWICYYSGIITSLVQIAFIASICSTIIYLVGEVKYNYKTFL